MCVQVANSSMATSGAGYVAGNVDRKHDRVRFACTPIIITKPLCCVHECVRRSKPQLLIKLFRTFSGLLTARGDLGRFDCWFYVIFSVTRKFGKSLVSVTDCRLCASLIFVFICPMEKKEEKKADIGSIVSVYLGRNTNSCLSDCFPMLGTINAPLGMRRQFWLSHGWQSNQAINAFGGFSALLFNMPEMHLVLWLLAVDGQMVSRIPLATNYRY